MPTGTQLGREVEILLIEDSPSDAELTQLALLHGKVKNKLHHVVDGVEALAFLAQEGEYAGAPRPDIILLDLNLPRKNGREVLEELKKHEEWRKIPVIVLTSSDNESDVGAVYSLNANSYIKKPVDLQQFNEVMRSFDSFWLSWVILPTNKPTDH